MEFNVSDFFAPNWLNAFGAMLFHSLWLGLLLSFLVAIIIFSTRKATARLRYNLLTGAMFLFVLAVSLVFYKAFGDQEIIKIQASATNETGVTSLTPSTFAVNNVESGIANLMNIWNAYSPQIVLFWFLVICIKSIQLFVGLNGVYHLRKNKVYAAGKIWEDKMDALAYQYGISRKVKIMQSGLAQVPMVIGHFKPLILIPLGLLNSISAEEVEAILCHELAHIKRKDYLVNLLQSLVEIIFFFNPAVIWVSKLMREERENCCDDLAVAKVENKKSYVKALIVCQEFQLNAPKYAMAFSNKKSPLFERVSRMLYNNQKTLNKMEKTILSAALISVVVFSATFSNLSAKGKHTPNTEKFALTQSVQDSLKNKLTKQKSNVDLEKEIEVRVAQQQKSNDLKAKSEDKINEKEYEASQKLYEAEQKRYDAEQKRYEAEQKKYEAEQKRYDSKQKQAEIDQKVKTAMQKSMDEARKKSGFPVPPTPPTPPSHGALNVPVAVPAPPVPPTAPDEEALLKQQTKPRKSSSKTSVTTSSQSSSESISTTDADEHDYKTIIKEMMKDGIIKTDAKLSYKLDKNSLIVNDKKQSEQFHQKYKNKYLPSNNSALVYQYEISGSN